MTNFNIKPLSLSLSQSLAIVLSTTLLTTTAIAGEYSTEVTQDQFKKIGHVVKVINAKGLHCGGMLVANKYVITAAHCIELNDPLKLDTSWLISDVTDTSKADIDVARSGMRAVIGAANYQNGKTIMANSVVVHPAFVFQNESKQSFDMLQYIKSEFDVDLFRARVYRGDVAIFTLDEPYIQSTASAIIATGYFTDLANRNKEIVTYGWGLMENGQYPASIRKTPMIYNIEHAWTDDTATLPELTPAWFNYIEHDTSRFTRGENNALVDKGDSGSPMFADGKVLSFFSSFTNKNDPTKDWADGTRAGAYIEWFAEQINAINTVGELAVTFVNSTTETQSWTFPVQNLTLKDVTFSPYIEDSSGLFVISDSTCEGTFAMGEDCEITLTFNANGSDVSSAVESQLILNDKQTISLKVIDNTPAVLPPTTPPVTEPKKDTGSSGGAFGWLLALVFIRFSFRK